ncbi:hypothetical protein EYF80_051610 [Liparis tanakae]|uniref:Uncharacterized protein n=1 Tax=Liparis tanakae TaxID=230148 RepID=A0A4Z2FAL4_9TELE|nr:hypothetical protein EYF80_051610 [Liparis tanakae]
MARRLHLHPRGDASHDTVCADTKMCKNYNWSVMVHLLLSGRVIPERRLALPAHYPLWREKRVGEVLCRSQIEKLAAKATAGEDAEFVICASDSVVFVSDGRRLRLLP